MSADNSGNSPEHVDYEKELLDRLRAERRGGIETAPHTPASPSATDLASEEGAHALGESEGGDEAAARQEAEAAARAGTQAGTEGEVEAKAATEAEAQTGMRAALEAESMAGAGAPREMVATRDAGASATAEADARVEAEARAHADEEARARAAAEARARVAMESKMRVMEQALNLAEERAKAEAEAHERTEAEANTRAEEEARARQEAEARAKAAEEATAQARVMLEAAAAAQAEAESKAIAEAEARVADELRATDQVKKIVKSDADAAVRTAEAARQEALAKADHAERALAEALAKAREEAQARAAVEAKLREEAEKRARVDAEKLHRETQLQIAREQADATLRAEMKALEDKIVKTREEAKVREEIERRAREEAEARAAAERNAREEAAARAAVELKAREEEIRRTRAEAGKIAAAERKAREQAEANAAAERKARTEAEARVQFERQTRAEVLRHAREEAEDKAPAEDPSAPATASPAPTIRPTPAWVPRVPIAVPPARMSSGQTGQRDRPRWRLLLPGSLLIVVLAVAAIALLNPTGELIPEAKRTDEGTTPQSVAQERTKAIGAKIDKSAGQIEITNRESSQVMLEALFADYSSDRRNGGEKFRTALMNEPPDSAERRSYLEVSGSRARFRSSPSETGSILRAVRQGTYVKVRDRANAWCRIRLPGGREGWMRCEFLKPIESRQPYPARPIRLVVGFAAGGATDVAARAVAHKLTESIGQTVIVDNRTGAEGKTAAQSVAKSSPDGYTMFLANATIATPSLFLNLPFDVSRDFAPAALIGAGPLVLVVHPSVPAKSVQELVALAKRHPAKLNYASGGTGNITHLAMALFTTMTGTTMVHTPYKGGAPARIAVVRGEADLAFSAIPSTLAQIQAGRLIALAVSSAKRSAALPDVATVSDAGLPGYEASSWYGIFLPAAAPKSVISKLSDEIVTALEAQDVKDRLISHGIEPTPAHADAFGEYLSAEMTKWAKVIADARIPPR